MEKHTRKSNTFVGAYLEVWGVNRWRHLRKVKSKNLVYMKTSAKIFFMKRFRTFVGNFPIHCKSRLFLIVVVFSAFVQWALATLITREPFHSDPHYYHHVSTMLFCWYCNQTSQEFGCHGYYFAAMNLTVHAVMYTDYAITSMGRRISPVVARMVTILQLSQMVVGVVVVWTHSSCPNVDRGVVWSGSLLYFTFFLLFAHFFYERYFVPRGKSGKSGMSGTSGVSGMSGTSGTSGMSGMSGTSGTSGTSGDQQQPHKSNKPKSKVQ